MKLQTLYNMLALILATLCLCGVAIYNGYPLVYPDTGDYIGLNNNYLRSFFYNLFLAPSLWVHTLWLVAAVQALIVAHLLRLVLRVVFGLTSPLAFLGVMIPLCLLSNLPWFTGFIMPDIFTGVLILVFFLLIFHLGQLGSGEKTYLIALAIVAVTVHLSHIPLALGLLAAAWLFKKVTQKQPLFPSPAPGWATLAVTAALILLLANGYRSYGTLTISPGGYVFPLARLVADGPAVKYLRAHCAEENYALCQYIDQLPANSDTFLWSDDSPFLKVGGIRGYGQEGEKIVIETVRHYPFLIVKMTLLNTLRQLPMINNWYGIVSYMDEPLPTDAIKAYFPGEFESYARSRQSHNKLSLRSFNNLHLQFITLCLLLAAVALFLYLKHRRFIPALFLAALVVAYGLSAFITAALSIPHNRYGSRLIWLLPFFCLTAIMDFIQNRRRQT
ncbi:MAG: hypothetical protein KKB94_10175 [Proteobacteria bacterium]|nr:hypothetical protein [Pseudomonadota bacterium]